MKGYFRKRGSTWSFVIDLPRDPLTNERRQKTFSGYSTKKEAEKACAEIITDIEKGNFVISNKTVFSFMEEFLENNVKHNVSPNTFESQKAFAVNHIYPELGDLYLNKVTPMHIQKFYNTKLNQGFSPGHIQNISNLLSKAFRTALEWGYVQKNVMPLVKKPSIKQRKTKTWTLEQSQYFLEFTKGAKYYVAYLLALTTGMRKGEILGLQWRNIDLQGATISVQQTIVYANNELYLKEPKTSAGKRLITLPDFVVLFLKKYKLEQPPNEMDLVVTGVNTVLLYPSAFDKNFNADLKRSGLPKIRFHDLRHTHATILLQLGENPKVVQERLGHANISTTLNTYSHVLPSMQKSLADHLNNAFTNTSK